MRLRDSDRIEHFHRTAAGYDDGFGADLAVQHALAVRTLLSTWRPEAALAGAPAGSGAAATGVAPVVLDVGCGTGTLLELVSRQVPRARLHGVEPAAAMLAIARDRLPGAHLHQAVSEEMPLPSGGVEAVLSTSSYGHWRNQPRGLAECRRVLRPGGVMVLVEHRRATWWQRLVYRVPDLPEPDALADAVGSAGFVDVVVAPGPGDLLVATGRCP